MNTLVEEYTDIVRRQETLRESLQPYANRFHDFVRDNPTFGYLQLSLCEESWATGDGYDLNFVRSETEASGGIYYSMTLQDYDYEVEHFFSIPNDYFADPDAWEKSFLETIENDVTNARNVFFDVFPKLKDEVESGRRLDIYNAYGLYEFSQDFLIYDIELTSRPLRTISFSRYFDYEDVLYNASHLFYQISTGKVVLSHNSLINIGEAETYFLERPLTTEEADQLPRTNWKEKGFLDGVAPDAFSMKSYNQFAQVRKPKNV